MLTRFLDILVALVGLPILGLMLPWVALLIKMDSRGPVFYGCNRVGKGGRLFKMFKFRTMRETEHPCGAQRFPPRRPPGHGNGPLAEADQNKRVPAIL